MSASLVIRQNDQIITLLKEIKDLMGVVIYGQEEKKEEEKEVST